MQPAGSVRGAAECAARLIEENVRQLDKAARGQNLPIDGGILPGPLRGRLCIKNRSTPTSPTTARGSPARGAARGRCWPNRSTTITSRSTTTRPRSGSASRAARSKGRPTSASSRRWAFGSGARNGSRRGVCRPTTATRCSRARTCRPSWRSRPPPPARPKSPCSSATAPRSCGARPRSPALPGRRRWTGVSPTACRRFGTR